MWDFLYILSDLYMGEKSEGEEEQVEQLQGRVNHFYFLGQSVRDFSYILSAI